MNVKDFKKWLLENELDENELFVESLICYNNRAYRAAYILSYLGFAEYIRNMIIEYDEVPLKFEEKIFSELKKQNSREKTNFEHYIASNYRNETNILSNLNELSEKNSKFRDFSKQMWQKRKELLNDDDRWDEEFKNIMLEAEYNIFLLSKSVRDEFVVKKDLRNVCAHNKSRSITDATVEDLWDYIKYVKPLVIINGTEQVVIESITNVVRFSNASEYETKAREIYTNYATLGVENRKMVFEKICKMIHRGHLEEEFVCALFEQIFHKRDCPEISWIKKNIDAELFVKLNVNNYCCTIDKDKIYEKMQSVNTDDDIFPVSIVFEFFRKSSNDQKKILFVKEIYNQENNYHHWLDLVISSDNENFYLQNEAILDIIVQKKHLECLFKDIAKLYRYNSQYGIRTTDTFDYRSFGREKITKKVFLALWLMKENKIDMTDDAKDVVKRCLTIMHYAKEYPNSNDAASDNILRRNEAIYDWLCAQESIV